MPYEEDEIRRRARDRLAERQRRSGAGYPGAQLPGVKLPAFGEMNPRVIGAPLALAALVIVVAVALSTCSGGAAASGEGDAREQAATESASVAADASGAADCDSGEVAGDASDDAADGAEPDKDALAGIIGEEEAAKLIAQAESSDDARWIAAHPDEFAFDGPEVQAKVLKLAADDPLALAFVRNFPAEYSQESPSSDEALALDVASPSEDVPSTDVPHLYQWDRRWGYTVYNADAFGLSGCGPTSLAMVYQAVTGEDDRTPYDMGQLAYEGGYVVEWLGTSNTYFTETADQLGLQCEEIDVSADSIRSALEAGKPIIANVGVGAFTSYGHFFVLAGVDDDGRLIINDPYSATRSSQTWDCDFIASESVALYAYSR